METRTYNNSSGSDFSPRADLERQICQAYAFIKEYEEKRRLANGPEERERAKKQIAHNWEYIQEKLDEYLPRYNDAEMPDDIRRIAEYLEPTDHPAKQELSPRYNDDEMPEDIRETTNYPEVTDRTVKHELSPQKPAPPSKIVTQPSPIPRTRQKIINISIIVTAITILAGIAGLMADSLDVYDRVVSWFATPMATQPPPTATTTNTPMLPTATPIPGEIRVIDGIEMIYVPGGGFLMGSNEPHFSEEEPLHTVYLDAFWIDRYEVTNGQYEKCVDAGVCAAPSKSSSYNRDIYYLNADYDSYPVIYVSWHDADNYCRWVNKRLPEETEWEKAARGTDGRKYPWEEDEANCEKINHDGCVEETTKVGTYPAGASPYGAMDMGGNIQEWTADWFQVYPGSTYDIGAFGEKYRVLRGGAFNLKKDYSRCAKRVWRYPDYRNYNTGFRCAASPAQIPIQDN